MSVGGLPGHTVQHMLTFMEKLSGMHEDETSSRSRYAYGMSLRRSRTSAGRRGELNPPRRTVSAENCFALSMRPAKTSRSRR